MGRKYTQAMIQAELSISLRSQMARLAIPSHISSTSRCYCLKKSREKNLARTLPFRIRALRATCSSMAKLPFECVCSVLFWSG
jgi:hypothetical protein